MTQQLLTAAALRAPAGITVKWHRPGSNLNAGKGCTSIPLVRVLSLLHHEDCMPCTSEAAGRAPSSHPCLVCCTWKACGRCRCAPLDTGAWLCCVVLCLLILGCCISVASHPQLLQISTSHWRARVCGFPWVALVYCFGILRKAAACRACMQRIDRV